MKSKILTLLLSLAISFGLWLYVVTVISPESESIIYDIPVELVGKDYLNNQNLIIISSTDNLRMDLTLSGNRSDLKKLNGSNVTVIADLSKITYPGEHRLDCSVSFGAGAAEVVDQEPKYVTVVVAEKKTKTIPVKVNYIGSVPSGYEEDRENVSMDHTTVTVSGPKETIDKIAYAGITVDLSGEMTTFVDDYDMVLCGRDTRPIADVSFVTSNVSSVRAVVQVNKIKKVHLKFELDFTDSGLSQEMVTIDPEVDMVTLIGRSDALDRMGDTLTFTIQLNKYSDAYTETFIPTLPEGVECVENIQVYIRVPEMVGRWLTVSQFVYENVPEGMNLQITDNPLIEIWGPREIMEQLSADQVYGIVDCTAATNALSYVPVTYIIPGYEYLHVRLNWNNSFLPVQHVEE